MERVFVSASRLNPTDMATVAPSSNRGVVAGSTSEGVEAPRTTQSVQATDARADGTALETYFLSAYRTLKVLEGSGALEEANVCLEDWVILRVLEKNYGPVDLKALAKATGIAPRQLRTLILRLADRSLVDISEEDSRQILTSVSHSGLSVLAKTSAGFHAIATELSRFNGRVFARHEVLSTHMQRILLRMRQKRRTSGAGQSGAPTNADQR